MISLSDVTIRQGSFTLSRVSLEGDNVFGDDGGVHELGTMTGDAANGLTVTLAVNVQG